MFLHSKGVQSGAQVKLHCSGLEVVSRSLSMYVYIDTKGQ